VGIKTETSWSEARHDYADGVHTYASLERSGSDEDHAELVVNGKRILLDAPTLMDLSQAASLIASEIQNS
jgi:hypothetical protein